MVCLASASAMSLGLRGDIDFGICDASSKTVQANGVKGATGGEVGLWFDMPFINLKVFTLGIRPDAEIAFNQGIKASDGSVTTTNFDVDLFLSASFNLAIIRISAGVGPNVSWAFKPVKKGTSVCGIPVNYIDPQTNWKNPSWGIGGFVQAGVKLGPGFLLGDVRFRAPFSAKEFANNPSGDLSSKIYKINVGLGYEFMF